MAAREAIVARVACRLLLGFCAMCVVLWLLTWVVAFEVFLHRLVIAVSLGKASVTIVTSDFGTEVHVRVLSQVARPEWFGWWPFTVKSQWGTGVFVPLWMPAVACGLPGGYLWLRRRRQHQVRESCKACGYDLRGLLDTRCPECGTPFQADCGGKG